MTDFNKLPGPRNERGWLTVVHGLIGVLALAALLLVAAPSWEYAVKDSQSAAAGLKPSTTALVVASPSHNGTGVPDAALVFRGNLTTPEPPPSTF